MPLLPGCLVRNQDDEGHELGHWRDSSDLVAQYNRTQHEREYQGFFDIFIAERWQHLESASMCFIFKRWQEAALTWVKGVREVEGWSENVGLFFHVYGHNSPGPTELVVFFQSLISCTSFPSSFVAGCHREAVGALSWVPLMVVLRFQVVSSCVSCSPNFGDVVRPSANLFWLL